jgi:hypothetical protein
MNEDYKTITADEIKNWCKGSFSEYTLERLLDIITGEYDLDQAREDILGFRQKDEHV